MTPTDSDLLQVEAAERDQLNGIATFPITLNLAASLWDRSHLETSLEVTCQLTGLTYTVAVRIKLLGTKEDVQKLGLLSLLVVTVAMFCTTITCIACVFCLGLTWRDVVMSMKSVDFYNLLFLFLAIVATVACLVIGKQKHLQQS